MAQLILARKLGVLLTLLLVLLLATHCGSEEGLGEPEAAQPAELRWVTFDPNSQVEELLADKYHEAHPNITFKREQNQFGSNPLSDPQLPDLMTYSLGNEFDEAIRNGQLADLTEVWNEAELEGKLIANLDALTLNEADGQRYLLPAAFSWAGFYYNKAIFEQYGLTPPQTWDEFVEICSTLYNNAERALAIPGSDSYSYTLWFDYLNLRINGAEFHQGLQAGRESYEDPRVFEVLETWGNLFKEGYVVEVPQSVSDLSAITALVRGDDGMLNGEEAVMVLMDTYSISQTPRKFLDELGFFPFPVINPEIPTVEPVGVLGYVVPANSDHGAAAQYFLAYLSSAEAQAMFAQEIMFDGATFAPARADLDDDFLTDDAKSGQELIQGAAEVVPFTFTSMPNAMWAGFSLGYQRFLYREYDPKSVIEVLEKARLDAIESGVFVQQ
jgi:ABC-type glycerol-3-phosphate transport system substrate-binding protein